MIQIQSLASNGRSTKSEYFEPDLERLLIALAYVGLFLVVLAKFLRTISAKQCY